MSLRIRRGGGTVAPPPPQNPYGPTQGAPSVRSGAGARTVSSPGTGIAFNSSSSLQSAINANATGSTFVCATNAPVWNTAVDTGTKAPTIIFPGTVGQCVIDGGGGPFIPIQLGINSTLKGGDWRNFGTASTTHGIRLAGDNVRVEDAVVSGMWDNGIAFPGNGGVISHCRMHHNGMGGYGGAGDNITIEYCEIDANNTRLVNPGNEGGAGKIVLSIAGWFHHNWVHGNVGFGAWWDTNCSGWLIEENVCEDNNLSGLFFEANYGSTMRRNYVANNGRNVVIGGFPASFENCVNVRLSDNAADRVDPQGQITPVDVQLNIVDDDGTHGGLTGGLLLVWDHSATSARHAANHSIHDNQFFYRSTTTMRLGGEDTAIAAYPVWSNNISFSNNQHRVTQTAITNDTALWKWDTGVGQGVAKTFSQWQAFHTSGEQRLLI